MVTAEDVIAFIAKSLAEMHLDFEGIGSETMLGPAGVDLDSIAVAELLARLEDRFGVDFPDDEVELAAIMTLGEFAGLVAAQAVQVQPEGTPR